MSIKWAALASGGGTILGAMYAQGLRPDLVVVDQGCPALSSANHQGIKTALVRREGKWLVDEGRADAQRVDFTLRLVNILQEREIEVVVMAGFLTMLAAEMFEAFPGHVLNTHPSLFNQDDKAVFPGAHAVRDALRAGVAITGCTQHVATAAMDCGPVLAWAEVRVPTFRGGLDEKTRVDNVQESIKQEERVNYPRVVQEVLTGAIDLSSTYTEWLVDHSEHPA